MTVLELVCDACGFRHCAEGVLLCDDARRAGFCTRDEWERRHDVEERRQERGRAAA
jgi:hypothetical protein